MSKIAACAGFAATEGYRESTIGENVESLEGFLSAPQ
jgi:hypothetical protein